MSRWHRDHPEEDDQGWEQPDPREQADIARDARREQLQEEDED